LGTEEKRGIDRVGKGDKKERTGEGRDDGKQQSTYDQRGPSGQKGMMSPAQVKKKKKGAFNQKERENSKKNASGTHSNNKKKTPGGKVQTVGSNIEEGN